MPDVHDERETKLSVPAHYTIPDLIHVAPGATVERSTVRLVSTYYDTDDLRLLAHHVTLRCRTGDADVGWQLKVPGKAVRTEIRLPLDGTTEVPDRILELVVGLAGGEPVRPVAEVRTERHLHRVETAASVVEVADDQVHATAGGDVLHVREWREVEAELVRGPTRLLVKVEKALREAGATPASSSSKLAQALGRVPGPVEGASDLVRTYLETQLAALGSGDVALRRGLDPIHRTRVATRRFRSALRVFGPLFDGPAAALLEAELSWYQDLLGEVRDREVLRARFARAVGELPVELVLGPVAADIEETLRSEQLGAREKLLAALGDERYRRLLGDLVAFVREPPLRADVTVGDLRKQARKARRTATKRLARAVRSDNPVALHRARKALKRARYGTELVRPVDGKSAKRLVRSAKKAQDVLGEHQDGVVAADVLLRLGRRLGAEPGRNGFTYGLLWRREQELARIARERATRLHFG